jgi:hypothetical protein
MSQKTRIKKNLSLSVDFNAYLLRNPKVMDKLPKKVCIVFEDKKDGIFSRANLNTARETSRREKCFVASKSGSRWSLRPLTTA